MPLSFLQNFHDGFSTTGSRQPSPFCNVKLGMLKKNAVSLHPPILSHGEKHLQNELT